jgi:hypothetical protein
LLASQNIRGAQHVNRAPQQLSLNALTKTTPYQVYTTTKKKRNNVGARKNLNYCAAYNTLERSRSQNENAQHNLNKNQSGHYAAF